MKFENKKKNEGLNRTKTKLKNIFKNENIFIYMRKKKFENELIKGNIKMKPYTINYFSKILMFSDLPQFFEQVNKNWWRWYCEIYGFYYERSRSNYCVGITMFLKNNKKLYMSLFMKTPVKKKKRSFKKKRKLYLLL